MRAMSKTALLPFSRSFFAADFGMIPS